MRIWINKNYIEELHPEYADGYIFNINTQGHNNVSSNIREAWYFLGTKLLTSIYEDLFILSLSVHAVDKKISRNHFADRWTRELEVSIPVINIGIWESIKSYIDDMLGYLSGDVWNVEFRSSNQYNRYESPRKRTPIRPVDLDNYEAVSLFSGGVDSFCGAITQFQNNANTCFVGFKDHYKLSDIQKELLNAVSQEFPQTKYQLVNFTAVVRRPFYNNAPVIEGENTSRTRSFLFICAAIIVAEIIKSEIPVYIPENGFIGLNLPLTQSRKGSCSTRTTHPHFLEQLNNILSMLGISHKIINPFAYVTKTEMVDGVSGVSSFVQNVGKTISCSHPCNTRWEGETRPGNCGYCFPCLIRRSSFQNITAINDSYTYDILLTDFLAENVNTKKSDLVALLTAVNNYKQMSDLTLYNKIRASGLLTDKQIKLFMRVYKDTMNDIKAMITCNPDLISYSGI